MNIYINTCIFSLFFPVEWGWWLWNWLEWTHPTNRFWFVWNGRGPRHSKSFDSRPDRFIASYRKHELFRRSRNSSTNLQHSLISGNSGVENRGNCRAVARKKLWLRQCPWLHSLRRYFRCLWWVHFKDNTGITLYLGRASVCLILPTALNCCLLLYKASLENCVACWTTTICNTM